MAAAAGKVRHLPMQPVLQEGKALEIPLAALEGLPIQAGQVLLEVLDRTVNSVNVVLAAEEVAPVRLVVALAATAVFQAEALAVALED